MNGMHAELLNKTQQAHPKDNGDHPRHNGSPLALLQLGQTAWPPCMIMASDKNQEACHSQCTYTIMMGLQRYLCLAAVVRVALPSAVQVQSPPGRHEHK